MYWEALMFTSLPLLLYVPLPMICFCFSFSRVALISLSLPLSCCLLDLYVAWDAALSLPHDVFHWVHLFLFSWAMYTFLYRPVMTSKVWGSRLPSNLCFPLSPWCLEWFLNNYCLECLEHCYLDVALNGLLRYLKLLPNDVILRAWNFCVLWLCLRLGVWFSLKQRFRFDRF